MKRVEIPKPGGGVRRPGVPTVVDRLIRQAPHQVTSRVFEPGFRNPALGVALRAAPTTRCWIADRFVVALVPAPGPPPT